jgi:hypothetical protein
MNLETQFEMCVCVCVCVCVCERERERERTVFIGFVIETGSHIVFYY